MPQIPKGIDQLTATHRKSPAFRALAYHLGVFAFLLGQGMQPENPQAEPKREAELSQQTEPQPQMSVRHSYLMIVVLLLSVATAAIMEAKVRRYMDFRTGAELSLLILAVNFAVGIAGFWTRWSGWWACYLIASLVSVFSFGSPTPFGALWIFVRVYSSSWLAILI